MALGYHCIIMQYNLHVVYYMKEVVKVVLLKCHAPQGNSHSISFIDVELYR